MVKIKRIYLPPEPADGHRVLVDRLWPRGVKKEAAALDEWNKNVAPSPELRIWFGHDPAKFAQFSERYTTELQHNPAAADLRTAAKSQTVTLLYAAKDEQHNHAVVLKRFLDQAS